MPSTITPQPYGTSGNLTIASRYSWSECGNFDDQSEPWLACSACGDRYISLPEHEDEVDEFEADLAVHEAGACVARKEAAAEAFQAEATARMAAASADPEPF